MRKSKVLLLAAAMLIFFTGLSMPVAAAARVYVLVHCPYCKEDTNLVSQGTHLYHHNSSHPISYIVDGNRVEETCEYQECVDRVSKYCPKHGKVWEADQHTIIHLNQNCPKFNQNEVFYE